MPIKENLYTPNCIRTFTGKYINVLEPTPEMICIEDIAHSLANQSRFGGHLPEFYSVAQHSVMCARNCKPGFEFQALMHDASEAYLLDMPKPIKNHLPEYVKIEDNLMQVIAEMVGFPFPLQPEIKEIDKEMLEFEWHYVFMQHPKPGYFRCWSAIEAKEKFLEEYHSILNLKETQCLK